MHLAAFHPRAHTLLSLRHRLSEAKDLLFPYRPPSSALYKVSFHFYLYLISFPKTEKKIPFSSFFSMFIFKGRVPPPFVLVLWMDHILHADWILYIFSWAAADEKECESYSRRPHRLVYLIPFPVQRVEEEGVVLFFFFSQWSSTRIYLQDFLSCQTSARNAEWGLSTDSTRQLCAPQLFYLHMHLSSEKLTFVFHPLGVRPRGVSPSAFLLLLLLENGILCTRGSSSTVNEWMAVVDYFIFLYNR